METTTPTPAPELKIKMKNRWMSFIQYLFDNPVISKELRRRMRGAQAPLLLSMYLGLIAIFILLIYNLLVMTGSVVWDPSLRQAAGKAIFGTVVLLELLLLSFIAPGLTSGAISAEREKQTYDLLRTTLLSGRSLVLGKLGSAFTFLILLILTALPIQSMAFLLGGVGVGEMIVSSLMLIVTALFFCTLGLYFSSRLQRTLVATVSSYATTMLSFVGLFILMFVLTFLESFPLNSSTVSQFRQNVLGAMMWVIISLNPLTAAIMSEVILVDEQNLFYTTSSFFGSGSIFGSSLTILPSPWILYTLFYTLMTLFLIFLSIRNVNRRDRT